MQRCEEALYAESSTVGGQPVSMPRDLLEATVQLDTMLRKLEVAILDVVTDVNNKKKVGFERGGGDNHLFFFPVSLSSHLLFLLHVFFVAGGFLMYMTLELEVPILDIITDVNTGKKKVTLLVETLKKIVGVGCVWANV